MKWMIVALSLISSAFAQDLQAERVQLFFRETAERLIPEVAHSPVDLFSVLRNGSIEVSNDDLVDNGGSLVDALGIPGKVTLSKARWMLFLRERRDVRLLVLHELLRMAAVNDDNYRVSRTLLPARASVDDRFYCDLRVARTVQQLETRNMNSRGFDNPDSNAYDSALNDLAQKCSARGYPQVRVLSGARSMRNANTNGYNTMISEVVMRGQCQRFVARPRPVAAQRAEGCGKVSLCSSLLSDGNIELQQNDALELDQVRRQWRCQ